jgi:flavin reductase (DIM6/NTAB) family NADH-FMN oxidoreductase RutF
MSFKEILPEEWKDNVFDAVSKEYMLITAGDETDYNMMTASWGFFGEMWGHHTAMVVVRPQRYTMDFIEKNDYFTLSFYGEELKDIHKVCGSKSGRDVDKTKETGLTPVFDEKGVYFKEARLVVFCKKEYLQQMCENSFVDKENLRWYKGDFHNMIFGKIEKIITK